MGISESSLLTCILIGVASTSIRNFVRLLTLSILWPKYNYATHISSKHSKQSTQHNGLDYKFENVLTATFIIFTRGLIYYNTCTVKLLAIVCVAYITALLVGQPIAYFFQLLAFCFLQVVARRAHY